MKTRSFYSNAKLLISGEYLVLKGAYALGVPLKVGQHLVLKETSISKPKLRWESWFNDQLVLKATFDYSKFSIEETNNTMLAERLLQILIAAHSLNPDFLSHSNTIYVQSKADFDLNWGVGSSSSLISNIAWWAGVDPYILNGKEFNGSGYDIACARSQKPILYNLNDNLPVIEEVDFLPRFHKNIYFMYLGSKTETQKALKLNGSRLGEVSMHEISVISEISKRMLTARNLDEFEVYMVNHEKILGDILGMMPIKYKIFPDFAGEIKSLGAWGGDFIMVTWKEDLEGLRQYFGMHKMSTIFQFDEFVKQHV